MEPSDMDDMMENINDYDYSDLEELDYDDDELENSFTNSFNCKILMPIPFNYVIKNYNDDNDCNNNRYCFIWFDWNTVGFMIANQLSTCNRRINTFKIYHNDINYLSIYNMNEYYIDKYRHEQFIINDENDDYNNIFTYKIPKYDIRDYDSFISVLPSSRDMVVPITLKVGH